MTDKAKRPVAYWFILFFLAFSALLFLVGQTLAVFNYEFTVSLGLQEDVKEISEFGVQLNRAFGASDSLVYIPLILMSIYGLLTNKPWSLLTTAAVMGISGYWATTAAFLFLFLDGVPGYSFVPGWDYLIFIGTYIICGLWGLWYLVFHGKNLLR